MAGNTRSSTATFDPQTNLNTEPYAGKPRSELAESLKEIDGQLQRARAGTHRHRSLVEARERIEKALRNRRN